MMPSTCCVFARYKIVSDTRCSVLLEFHHSRWPSLARFLTLRTTLQVGNLTIYSIATEGLQQSSLVTIADTRDSDEPRCDF